MQSINYHLLRSGQYLSLKSECSRSNLTTFLCQRHILTMLNSTQLVVGTANYLIRKKRYLPKNQFLYGKGGTINKYNFTTVPLLPLLVPHYRFFRRPPKIISKSNFTNLILKNYEEYLICKTYFV